MSAAEESAATAEGATYVRTADWFCRYGACPGAVNGVPVYFDGVHLTAQFSRRLAPVLLAGLQTRKAL